MTPHQIYLLILSKNGSLREVSEEIGKTKAYVSYMRKIARDATTTLLSAWEAGDIPFDLTRRVVNAGNGRQASLVREYVKTTKGRNKKARGEARATLLAALREDSNA